MDWAAVVRSRPSRTFLARIEKFWEVLSGPIKGRAWRLALRTVAGVALSTTAPARSGWKRARKGTSVIMAMESIKVTRSAGFFAVDSQMESGLPSAVTRAA